MQCLGIQVMTKRVQSKFTRCLPVVLQHDVHIKNNVVDGKCYGLDQFRLWHPATIKSLAFD